MIFFQTLGTLDLRSEATQVRSVLTQPKRLALLAFLAVERPRDFHSRDRLLALFWPESDPERARNALRQSLHYLRRSLGDGVIVSRGDREVGVEPGALRCDAVAFDDAIESGRHAEALDLYQGDFLAGLYVDDAPAVERWIEDTRVRFRRDAVAAARAAADAEEARGGRSAAVLLLRRALALAPHDEVVLRHLLELLERAGARSDAMHEYESFVARFRADFGLEPSPEVRAVIDRIKASEAAPASPASEPHGTVAAAAPTPFDVPPASAVSSVPDAVSDAVSGSVPGAARLRRTALAVLAVLIVGLAGALTVTVLRDRPAAPSGTAPAQNPVPTAVAVLPFANLSGDPEQEYLSDGVAEELMTALARIPELRVVARTSAFSFRSRAVSADSIARALRATHVVEGSVRHADGRVRVTAQLVDGLSGYQLWGGTFAGTTRDLFAMQDSIARAIVAVLEPNLVIPRGRASAAANPDPEAHAHFLRGIAARGRDTPEGIAQAERHFNLAIERDSAYAQAWAGLAEIRTVESYRRRLPEESGYDEARAFAERALDLDPTVARAHVVLGRIAGEHAWDFEAAERHFRRALELEPGSVIAMRGFARLLAHLGRKDEALELSLRSVERDPVAPVAHRWLGSAYMLTGEHARAVETLGAVLAVDSANPIASISLALALDALGRSDEAVAAAERALAAAPDEQLYLAHTAAIRANAGDSARARELLARLDASPRPAAYYRAMILAALGDFDGAFRELDRSIASRESVLAQVGAMPSFEVLRGDPRFDEVLRRVGLRR